MAIANLANSPPLSTDADAIPREPVGDRVDVAAVPYREDGSFAADLGEVTVPGRANPISGTDIVATVVIEVSALPKKDDLPVRFCGSVSGMVSVPLPLDLAGSSIAGAFVFFFAARLALPHLSVFHEVEFEFAQKLPRMRTFSLSTSPGQRCASTAIVSPSMTRVTAACTGPGSMSSAAAGHAKSTPPTPAASARRRKQIRFMQGTMLRNKFTYR